MGARLIKKGTGGFSTPPFGEKYPDIERAISVMNEWQKFWDSQKKAMRK